MGKTADKIALYRVSERVERGVRRETERHGHIKLRVEQRDVGENLQPAEGRLVVYLVVGDDCACGDLRACAGGRRYHHEHCHRALDGLRLAAPAKAVIHDVVGVGVAKHGVNTLCRVHCRAAAYADDRVHAELTGELAALVYVVIAGVGLDLRPFVHVNRHRLKACNDLVSKPGLARHLAEHEHCLCHTLKLAQPSGFFPCVLFKESKGNLSVEAFHYIFSFRGFRIIFS